MRMPGRTGVDDPGHPASRCTFAAMSMSPVQPRIKGVGADLRDRLAPFLDRPLKQPDLATELDHRNLN